MYCKMSHKTLAVFFDCAASAVTKQTVYEAVAPFLKRKFYTDDGCNYVRIFKNDNLRIKFEETIIRAYYYDVVAPPNIFEDNVLLENYLIESFGLIPSDNNVTNLCLDRKYIVKCATSNERKEFYIVVNYSASVGDEARYISTIDSSMLNHPHAQNLNDFGCGMYLRVDRIIAPITNRHTYLRRDTLRTIMNGYYPYESVVLLNYDNFDRHEYFIY